MARDLLPLPSLFRCGRLHRWLQPGRYAAPLAKLSVADPVAFLCAIPPQLLTRPFPPPLQEADSLLAAQPGQATAGWGGVIYYHQPAADRAVLVVRHSAFWNNDADEGGVVYADAHAVVAMSGVVAINNTALSGGVVHCERCALLAT